MDRNPRTDPKRGDVLRTGPYAEVKVTGVEHGRVFFEARRLTGTSRSCCCLKTWREWAESAQVVMMDE